MNPAEDLCTEAIREATDAEAGAAGGHPLAELIARLTAGKKTLSQVTTGIHLGSMFEVQPLQRHCTSGTTCNLQGLLAELGKASWAASQAAAGQNGFDVDPLVRPGSDVAERCTFLAPVA